MKVSKKQALELLSALLADAEVVDEDNPEFNKDASLQSVYDKIVGEHRPAIEQEVEGKVKTQLHGQLGDLQRKQVAKAFGITDKKELEGLNLDAMLEKGKGLYAQSLKLNAEDWNAKNLELSDLLNAERSAHETALQQANAEWEKKYNSRDVNARFLDIMSKIKTVGGDVTEQASMLQMAAQARGYDVRYDAEKKANQFYKDNQLVIEDGKVIDDSKFATTWAEKAGILAKDNRHDPPGRHVSGAGNPPPSNGKANPNDPYAAVKSYIDQ